MKDIKAAQIIHSLAPGGAERVVCHLADRLRDFQIDCEVFCLGQGGMYQDTLQKEGIPVWGLGKKSKWGGPMVTLKLAGLLKRRQVTVMHAHNLSAGFYGRTAAVLARVPVRVVTFHSYTKPHTRLQEALNTRLYPKTSGIIAVSRFVREGLCRQYPAWGPDRLHLVYNGLDTDGLPPVSGDRKKEQKEMLGLDPGMIVIGTVASLIPVKNQAMLLEAARTAIEKMDNLVFLMVGGGPLEADLKQQARELGISSQVVFAGVQQDVFQYLAAMDLFVLSSWKEGLPMSLLEAMASALPVVATAVGGIPEAVVHGECGLLCEEGSSKDLAEKILEAVSQPRMLQQWGAASRARVEKHFSLDRMCRQTADLYRETLAKAKDPI